MTNSKFCMKTMTIYGQKSSKMNKRKEKEEGGGRGGHGGWEEKKSIGGITGSEYKIYPKPAMVMTA